MIDVSTTALIAGSMSSIVGLGVWAAKRFIIRLSEIEEKIEDNKLELIRRKQNIEKITKLEHDIKNLQLNEKLMLQEIKAMEARNKTQDANVLLSLRSTQKEVLRILNKLDSGS